MGDVCLIIVVLSFKDSGKYSSRAWEKQMKLYSVCRRELYTGFVDRSHNLVDESGRVLLERILSRDQIAIEYA